MPKGVYPRNPTTRKPITRKPLDAAKNVISKQIVEIAVAKNNKKLENKKGFTIMANLIRRSNENAKLVNVGEFIRSDKQHLKERTDGKRKNLVVTDRFADQLVDFEGLRRCERAVKNAEYNKNRRKVKIGTPEENADRLRALGIKVIS